MLFKFFIARSFLKILEWLNIRVIDEKATKFLTELVDKVVKERDETGKIRPDMIQLMMNARRKDNKYLKLDIQEMTSQAFLFFFCGFDTTSIRI